MNIYQKLMECRKSFAEADLKKTGKNEFSNYSYFELRDFLPRAQVIFREIGLCPVCSFGKDESTMVITDMDCPEDKIVITSPTGSAKLKACHEVQNIGAVETYQRRYLYVAALEIVEHDAIDSSPGEYKESQKKEVKKEWLNPANNKMWANAIAAFKRDGNLDAVLKRVNISSDNKKKLEGEANAAPSD